MLKLLRTGLGGRTRPLAPNPRLANSPPESGGSSPTRRAWRTGLLAAALGLMSAGSVLAQANRYTFSQSNGTFTVLGAGATTIMSDFDTSLDDQTVSIAPPGYTFTFNGAAYTQFYASANGYLSFGSVDPGGSTRNPLNTAGGITTGVAAPLGGDLSATSANFDPGTVKYQVSGSVLTVEWLNMASYAGSQVYNFQLKLDNSNNTIRFVYGAMTGVSSRQIGIRSVITDFSSRVFSNTVTSWTRTATSSANSGLITTATGEPASGLTYTWTPGACAQVATPAAATGVVQGPPAEANLNWSAPTPAPASGYNYRARLVGTAPWTVTGSTAAGVTTAFVNSGLSGGTWEYEVQADCGAGSLGNWSPQRTFIVPSALTLGAITGTQLTTEVLPNSSNNGIMAAILPVTGSAGTLTVTGATVTFAGTAVADVAAAGVKLYYTTTATFSTTNPVGTAQSFSGTTATFAGLTRTLAVGNNYLWVAYDVAGAPPVVIGNLLDARFAASAITVTASGGAAAPGASAAVNPAGARAVGYCVAASTQAVTPTTADDNIGYLTLGPAQNAGVPGAAYNSGTPVTNNTGGNNSTINNPLSTGTYSFAGATSVISVDRSSPLPISLVAIHDGTTYGTAVRAFADWNQDGDFADAGEASNSFAASNASSSPADQTISFNFNVPAGALLGNTRLRIVLKESATVTATSYCGTFTYGEVEDYTITVTDPPCAAPALDGLSLRSNNSIRVNYTLNAANVNGVDIIYNAGGAFNPNMVGTTVTGASPSTFVNLTGLTGGTTYTFYIRGKCSSGNTPTPALGGTFTTACDPFSVTFITPVLATGFEGANTNLPACWGKVITSSGGTLPAVDAATGSASAGTRAARLYNGSGVAGDVAILVTPMIGDLGGPTPLPRRVKFKARSTSAANQLLVGTMSDPDNAATFTTFATIPLTTTFQTFNVPFNTYTGSDKFIAFRHSNGSTFTTIYLDEFQYGETPACLTPTATSITNVTDQTARVNFTPGAGTADVAIAYGTGAFGGFEGVPSGTANSSGYIEVYGITGNFYDITGLTAGGTNYNLYIAANCNANGFSDVDGAYPFTTANANLAFNVTRTSPFTFNSIQATGATFMNLAGSGDDQAATIPLPAGFTINYLGSNYTQLSGSTNGWVALRSTTASAFSNQLSNTANPLTIAPFWDDLRVDDKVSDAAGLAKIRYQVFGTAPNRYIVVEWGNVRKYNATGADLSFQTWIYEDDAATAGTNESVIRFVYGTMSGFDGATNAAYDYSLGLTSATGGNGVMAQAAENTRFFVNRIDGSGTGNNGLSILPECNSRISFTPGSYVAYVAPAVVALANDDCGGAVTLGIGTVPATTYCQTYATANATASTGVAVCSAPVPGTPTKDVWAKFTVVSPGTNVTVRASGSYNFDAVMQVFSGTCAALTQIACRNAASDGLVETYTILNAAPGTYYVRVYDADASSPNGTFVLDVYEVPTPPANDECSTAATLTPATNCVATNGTTAGATASSFAVPTCTANPDDDVWYQFTPTSATNKITVVSNGTFDAVLNVFSGTCGAGNLTQMTGGCVNVTGIAGTETFATNTFTVGQTYYIRVYHAGAGYVSGANTFSICVQSVAAPANNNIANATTLNVTNSCIEVNGTTIGATGTADAALGATVTSTYEPVPLDVNNDDDVFYKFVAPGSGVASISVVPTSPTFDAAFQVLTGTLGNLTVVGSQQASVVGFAESLDLTGLTGGDTYYVRVAGYSDYNLSSDGFNPANEAGTFTICVTGGAKFISSVLAQQTTFIPAVAPAGTDNNPSVQIFVDVAGSTGTLTLKKLNATWKGTDKNDVKPNGVKLWSQPNGNFTFDPILASVLATTSIGADDTIRFVSNYAMPVGTNNFFITYNLKPTATVGNKLDTKLNARQLVVLSSASGTLKYPAMTLDPANDVTIGTPPPANDAPCSAILLPVATNGSLPVYQQFTTVNATASQYIASCVANTVNDVWFKTFIPASGTLYIDTREGVPTPGVIDGVMSVFGLTGANCAAGLVSIACDDDGSDVLNSNSLSWAPVLAVTNTPGKPVYIRYAHRASTTPGTFRIALSDRPTFTGLANSSLTNVENYLPGQTAAANNNLTIPAGLGANNPVVSANASLGGLTIMAGATLNQTAGTLTLGRYFSNNGTYNQNVAATLAIGGTSGAAGVLGPQNAPIQNLSLVSGGTGTNQAANVAVSRLLTVNSAHATNGFALTLQSNATQSAMQIGTGTVTGEVTVQRYVDPSSFAGEAYRHFSSPVNTVINDLSVPPTYRVRTNTAYNAAPYPVTTLLTAPPTIYEYSETRVGTVAQRPNLPMGDTRTSFDFEAGYRSPSSVAVAMAPMKGFAAYMPAGLTPDLKGTLNSAASYSSGTLNHGGNSNSGWQLLGNPYAAPIDWALVTAGQLTGMNNSVSFLKTTSQYSSSYVSFVNGVGPGKYVPVGQGFFTRVATIGGSGSVTIEQADRVATYQNVVHYRQAADSRPKVMLNLFASNLTANQGDETWVYFEQGATADMDAVYDAPKIASQGTTPTLATISGSEYLAISGLPLLTGQTIVPLVVVTPQTGSYTFNVGELVNFDSNTQVLLRDALTGTDQDLSLNPTYVFTTQNRDNDSRFSLVFNPLSVVTGVVNTAKAGVVDVYPNPVSDAAKLQVRMTQVPTGANTVTATLINALGQRVAVQQLAVKAGAAEGQFATRGLAAGVYTLRLTAGQVVTTHRVVVE